MAYYFGIEFVGSVNLEAVSVETKTTLPIAWEYVCDDESYPAPYWPQNHDARASCLNHACLPATAMPSAVRFKVSDWGITPLALPSPIFTDPGFIRVSETARTDEQVVYEGLDAFGQSWRMELRLLRRDVYYAPNRAEWGEQAFGAELLISVTAGSDRCILFEWTGQLQGTVPVDDLDPVPAMFRRGLSIPADPASRWIVTLELLSSSAVTPCNKEGTPDAPFLWLQREDTVARDKLPWFYSRESAGRPGFPYCISVNPDRFQYRAFSINNTTTDWIGLSRLYCLDFGQFSGGVHTFTHTIRCTNLYASITIPEIPFQVAPRVPVIGFDAQVMASHPAFVPTLFYLQPAFPFASLMYVDAWAPSAFGPIYIARLQGTTLDNGEIEFGIEVKLVEILPRVGGIPLYRATYTLVQLGNRYLLLETLVRFHYVLAIGIAPRAFASLDEWPNPGVWSWDPTSGLILEAPWPTVRVNLPVITSP